MKLTGDMDFSLRSRIRIIARSLCSVGHVVETIARHIVHSIKVEDLKFTVLRRQKSWDVGRSIPCIYIALDNRQVDHHASIIEMEGKLCE